MKREIFNQYVDEIVKLFRISKEDLFTKSKTKLSGRKVYLVLFMCNKTNET